MKLSLRINFITNLYSHIENITAYHRWSNPHYCKYFASTFDREAKRLLINYKKFRYNNPFDRKYEAAFASKSLDGSLGKLQHLSSRDRALAKDVFLYFKDGYRKVWEEHIKSIKYLEKDICVWWKQHGREFLKKGRYLTKNLPKKVAIFLCWNPIELKATPFGGKFILLETNSNVPSKAVLQAISHELGHLLDISYGSNSLSMLQELYGLEKGTLFHEAIISLFFPVQESKASNSTWNNKVRSLSYKLKPILKTSRSKNEDYQKFLQRTLCFLCRQEA